MAFNRPTLPELVNRATADFDEKLDQSDARLRRSALGVLGRVHAGAAHGLYGHLAWIARQVIYDTAEVEILERWTAIWGITRKPAAHAIGEIEFAGNEGALVDAGARLQRNDGAEYETTEAVEIEDGVATAAASAIVAGASGNAEADGALTLLAPIAGVNGSATIAAGGFSQGTDAESDESLRARFLERIQQPPHGGADFDYVKWAKEVPGVTRAWCYPNALGLGTVTVRFMRDDDDEAIPDIAEVQVVQDYIDALRPVTAAVTVVAPIAVPLDFTIELTPNVQSARDAVIAGLEDLILREAEPGGTLLISHIREALSLAAGETDHQLVLPAADVESDPGRIAVLGTITWQ